MTRFRDKVGYVSQGSLVDGVQEVIVTERVYKGEVLEATSSLQDGEKVNDDIRLQDRISVLADAYGLENFSRIKFVVRMGIPWIAQTVRVERPRIIISLGGVYHGPRATAPEEP
jgi:hypothetical protein